MILVLHHAARYLALAFLTAAGTFFAAILAVRHICRIEPGAPERLMACIAEMLT